MSSQMFWLLSYVSLGLALTLGNRASGGIHGGSSSSSSSTSSHQQKQQSTSSSLKSRQESRLSRDETSRILRPGEANSMLLKPDNLASYRYDDLPLEFQDGRHFRGEIAGSDEEEEDDDDDRISKDARENLYLDEFATAVLDTLYPRNRDFFASDKSTKGRFNSVNNARSIVSNDEPETRIRRPRLTSRTRSGKGDSPRKIFQSPIVVYRADRTSQSSMASNDRVRAFSRDSQSEDSRDSVDWPLKNGKELTSRAVRTDHLTKRRDNEIDDRWVDGDNEIVNGATKRDDVGRGRNVNAKTSGGWTGNGQQSQPSSAANLGAGIASQFLLRSARGNRQYDVPQIECPASEDGMERFACPTPDRMGRYRCIDDHVLCDGFIDCPTAEDEDRQSCMFYKTTKAHLDVLADALLRWARGR